VRTGGGFGGRKERCRAAESFFEGAVEAMNPYGQERRSRAEVTVKKSGHDVLNPLARSSHKMNGKAESRERAVQCK
jgi:hypothetical protein